MRGLFGCFCLSVSLFDGYVIWWLILNLEVKLERVDEMLHRCFAGVAHVGAPFLDVFRVGYYEFLVEGFEDFDSGLAVVAVGDVDQNHGHQQEHLPPVFPEEFR